MKQETLNKTSVSEHTPGPWHVSEMEGKTVSIITQDAIDNWDDAIPDICQFTKGCNANAEANAHLIAAAPDMLEALKAIAARLNGDWDNPALLAYGEMSDSESGDILGYAEAAIDKATNNRQ